MTVQISSDRGIGRLVLNRPPLNILTGDLLREFRAALDALTSDPHLRVIVLSAVGKHFSAGADVAEHLPPDCEAMIPEFIETIQALDRCPIPLIAAVQGRCLGGGFELVQPADIILAADSATFGQPEIMLGVLPPAACALLPEMIPPQIAADIVLTGDPIDAAEAQRVGLVRSVVPNDELATAANAVAERIARHSGAALRQTKRALRIGRGAARSTALAAAGGMYLHELMATSDAVEGLQAFLDKRAPAWSNA